jgi:hypothetical protein
MTRHKAITAQVSNLTRVVISPARLRFMTVMIAINVVTGVTNTWQKSQQYPCEARKEFNGKSEMKRGMPKIRIGPASTSEATTTLCLYGMMVVRSSPVEFPQREAS